MIGFAPAGEVVLVEMFAVVAKPGDDVGVRNAVLEHAVDLLAEGGREVADLSSATAVKQKAERAVEVLDNGLFVAVRQVARSGWHPYGLVGLKIGRTRAGVSGWSWRAHEFYTLIGPG